MTKNELTQADVNWIVKNWDKIDSKYKSHIKPNSYSQDVSGLSGDEHYVVLLLDRQRPSVYQSYDFDEERVGVTRTGKLVWGFDSGCSCPSPWDDSYPNCYTVDKNWKEFEVKAKTLSPGQSKYDIEGGQVFDAGWSEEAKKKVEEIKRGVEDGLTNVRPCLAPKGASTCQKQEGD